MYPFFKRMMDFMVAFIALPFWLIILVVVAILIKLDDGGPIFYTAERLGKGGKMLKMLKFRSMKVNAENIVNADGNTFNSANDARVTKIGRFLRETSLDETPQLLNVLTGGMSIIGPRASEYDSLESYKEDELDKLKVRPGISGYTQAYYRNSISAREKRLYDAWYANNMSFKLDVKIFFKTIETVLLRKNLYSN